MTHTLANGVRILTIPWPDAVNIAEIRYRPVHSMLEWKEDSRQRSWAGIGVEPGTWTLLGRFEEITEETWKGVMEPIEVAGGNHGRDYGYVNYRDDREHDFNTATESARSLIEGNPVVLIERKKE